MTSTILWFMLASTACCSRPCSPASGLLARADCRFGPSYLTALRLMLVNMFLDRVHVRAVHRDAAAQSVGDIQRVHVRAIGRDARAPHRARHRPSHGHHRACIASDVILTVILLPLMWPWFRPLVGAVFSVDELRTVLRFGLPRLPHGLASQTLDGNPEAHARPARVAERSRHLSERRHARHGRLVLQERLRDRVRAVLLRHGARTGRQGSVRQDGDLRRSRCSSCSSPARRPWRGT